MGTCGCAAEAVLDRKDVAAVSKTVILVGNPNVGKSVVFGALTGKYVTVSNYPGTTVEVTRGTARIAGEAWQVMDTPGTNNLTPMSEDEQVTRDILLDESEYVCVQVCDSKNLRRGLLLATQLAEAQVPFVLALNMADEARSRGFHIDDERLAKALGVDVIPTVAVQRAGIATLSGKLSSARPSTFRPIYDDVIEAAVADLERILPTDLGIAPRAVALMVLAGDESLAIRLRSLLPASVLQQVDAIRRSAAERHPESLRYIISRQRLQAADQLHDQVVTRSGVSTASHVVRKLGLLAVHPLLGIPMLAAALFACYEFVGVFGAGTLVNFLENSVFYDRVVPWTERAIRFLAPSGPVTEFLVGPAGVPFRDHGGFIIGKYGLVSMGLSYGVAIVLPIVTTFFLAFSVLEDSGYLPRLAVMLNKGFKAMGLNGKAVIPMVLGLGCDTMATMTARIMETRKERVIVTLLLALGVPCSAQMGVILAMAAGLSRGSIIWFVGSIVFTLLIVGFLAARIMPGRGSDFVLELPPMRIPQAGNVAVKTMARIEWYLREALPLFLVGTLILYVLNRVHGIEVLERFAAPVVVGVLQLPKEAAMAFILGFLRRDYAAAGLFKQFEPYMRAGTMTTEMEIQATVALVTMTLFVPCIANFFMILKERGWKTGVAITAFILPFAVGVGGVVNVLMRWTR